MGYPAFPPAIFSGFGAKVVASGTVIAFDRHSVSIYLGPPARPLSLRFEFVDDASATTSRMDVLSGDDPSRVTLKLINFNDPAGRGNEKPIKLGTLEGLSLYVNFRVHSLKDSPPTLHYTFYQQDDAKVAELQREAILKAFERGFIGP